MNNNKNMFICLYSKLLVVIKQHSKYYQFMNYSFEYIDIILLAMIAGFIFLRLRGILGKKTGFEGKISTQFEKEFQKIKISPKPVNENFDEEAKKDFLNGARIAYETIITDFSDGDNKLIASKPLLSKKIHDQFKEALLDRENKGHFAEITFIGIKSAVVKTHKKIEESLEVTVDFVSEIITCIKDKDKKIISGDGEKIKTVYDTWVFSKDIKTANPNWLLIDTIT
jgi:predicted lipid-binding transport protein (Tim44 family)